MVAEWWSERQQKNPEPAKAQGYILLRFLLNPATVLPPTQFNGEI